MASLLSRVLDRFGGREKALHNVSNRSSFSPYIREPYTGAWEQNQEISQDTLLTSDVIFACMTLIASDMSKLPINLVRRDDNGIKTVVNPPAYASLLRSPNQYQTRQQFIEKWMLSKLSHGNAYALKFYDDRGTVNQLHILDSARVKPLISDDGSVFYQIYSDELIQTDYIGYNREDGYIVVPARAIIHDRMNCLYHPLVGLSPVAACALAASTGHRIQQHQETFFKNNARPGGLLTVPGHLDEEMARAINTSWERKFGAGGSGKLAIFSDGTAYTPISSVNPVDSELVAQANLSAQSVCRAFHVPAFMVGVGDEPSYNNVESRSQSYYSQTLQVLIEALESVLERGLGIGPGSSSGLMAEVDIDSLMRMDTATQMTTLTNGVGAGILAPNEARKRLNLKPIEGGDTVYLQKQNYSLQSLANRDASDNPFADERPQDDTEKALRILYEH